MARREAIHGINLTKAGESWLEDPVTQALVKAQVEDVDLVKTRRAQITKSAINIISRKGYHATTIKEIAADAGVSPGLIYQYAGDKEEVLFLALQFLVYTLRKTLPVAFHSSDHPVRKFLSCFDTYCRVIDMHKQASILTYREMKSLRQEHKTFIKGMELETNEFLAGAISECIEAGYFRETDVEIFVYHAITLAQAWATKNWRLSKITTIDKYIRNHAEFLLRGAMTETSWAECGEELLHALDRP